MRWRAAPDVGPRRKVEGDIISPEVDSTTYDEYLMVLRRCQRPVTPTNNGHIESFNGQLCGMSI